MASHEQTLALAATYARYFVEDFSQKVLAHLNASYPLTPELRAKVLNDAYATESFAGALELKSENAVTRFLYECAQYVLTENVGNAVSRQTWDMVRELPSVHHADINALTYNSASLYHKTMSKTVIGVIARDAHVATESIGLKAQARTDLTETGGTLKVFNWGKLSDGLWLNGALMKANDVAKIFHPDDRVVASFAPTAFATAYRYTRVTPMEDDQTAFLHGELNLLYTKAQIENPDVDQQDLAQLLYKSGALSDRIAQWEAGMSGGVEMVAAVEQLSHLAQVLPALIHAPNDDDLMEMIGEVTQTRLIETNNAVTMCLVAFEALRESRYNDSLILGIESDGTDPKVDVFVNGDLLNSYRNTGGDDSDLIHFGLYFDPRRGFQTPTAGYAMEALVERRDRIVVEMVAEEADRIEKLRNNDAAAIESLAVDVIKDVATSYLAARNIQYMPSYLSQKISYLGRDVANATREIKLDQEITTILLDAMEDPFVSNATQHFMTYLEGETADVQNHAPAMTIARMAIDDAVAIITKD